MAEIAAELRKIPPVTRFLVFSSAGTTLPALLGLVSPWRLFFVRELVFGDMEVWRLFTSFFIGSMDINYIFELAMLYRNSNGLELQHYERRSSDYAWQLLLASVPIVLLTLPLRSFSHTRALLHALTYLSSALAPPGAITSIFGLVNIPTAYYPYALLFLDLLVGGRKYALQGIVGMVVGHLWWWGVFGRNGLGAGGGGRGSLGGWAEGLAKAPRWLRDWFGERAGENVPAGRGGGVYAYPPRPRAGETSGGAGAGAGAGAASSATGYRWGSGQRLGDS
ncbi:Der1-like family-domain-containing protein [Hygrophoropsis aurantiaca]|uniref:Der1-like family-domain-containing protein n=1 Tax=Hygrophoropsis aurantiaca TaxID=72124 RepID=A0ACB8AB12_9AGAM|nr:Der1-like family-domain-containing protein [Hygrophoropsis aurantiaca]